MHISHMGVEASTAAPHEGATKLGCFEYLVEEDSSVGSQRSNLPVSLSSVVPVADEDPRIDS
tara:strand:+ start:901 stop:1086 length:186 start_codon:yes stop_codon:yes gene_type:complete